MESELYFTWNFSEATMPTWQTGFWNIMSSQAVSTIVPSSRLLST